MRPPSITPCRWTPARPLARAEGGRRSGGSEAGRVAGGVARRGALLGLPARVVVAAPARVEAQPRHDHVYVAAVGVDGDPLAGAGVAPAREAAGRQRVLEQARAVEREGDGARAVVAGVVPLAVTAAVLVRLARDLVAGRDDLLDLRRGAGRGGREAGGADGRLRGGVGRPGGGGGGPPRPRRPRGPPG